MGDDTGRETDKKYNRVLLKLSGESLMGEGSYGIEPSKLQHYANEIKGVVELGVEVAVVIGGGNIYRGLQASATGIEKASEVRCVPALSDRVAGTGVQHVVIDLHSIHAAAFHDFGAFLGIAECRETNMIEDPLFLDPQQRVDDAACF